MGTAHVGTAALGCPPSEARPGFPASLISIIREAHSCRPPQNDAACASIPAKRIPVQAHAPAHALGRSGLCAGNHRRRALFSSSLLVYRRCRSLPRLRTLFPGWKKIASHNLGFGDILLRRVSSNPAAKLFRDSRSKSESLHLRPARANNRPRQPRRQIAPGISQRA